VLAEKRFTIGEISRDDTDPLKDLKSQKRIEDILQISNHDGESIGQIFYQATWIFNKAAFLGDLLANMNREREGLVYEIKQQDRKL